MTLLPLSLRLDLIGAPGSATPPVATPPAPASPTVELPQGLAEAIDQISSQLGFTPNQKTALTNTFSRILSGEIILAPYGQGGAPLCVYIDEAGNQHQLLGAGDPLSKLIPAETGLLNGPNLYAQLTKYYTEHNLGTATDIEQIQAAVIADLAGGDAQLAETLRQRIEMIAAAKLFYANAQNELSLGYFESKDIAGFGRAYELNTTLPGEVATILQAGPPEDSSVLQRFVRALLSIDGVEGIEEFSLEQIINFYGQKLDAGFFSRIPVTNENAEKIYYQLGLLEVDGDRTYRAYLFNANAILSAISTGSLNGSSIRGGCIYVESESVITENPILKAALWLGHITYQVRPEYFAGAGDSGKIYMELWTNPGNPDDYNLVQCSYLLNRYLHSESAAPGPNLYLNDYLTLKFVEGELGRVNTDSHFIALRNALRTAGVDSIDLSSVQAQNEEQEEELELRTDLIDTAPVDALIDNGVEMVIGFDTETVWGGEDDGEETVSVTGVRFEGGSAPTQAVILDWIRARLTSMGISSDELGYGEQITPRLLTYLINLYNIMLNEAGGNQIQGAGQFIDNLESRLAQPIENYVWDLSAEGVHTQRVLELFLSQGGLLIEGVGIGGPEFIDINALQTMVRAMHAMFTGGQIYDFIRVPVRLMETIEAISTVNIQMEAIKTSIDQLAAKAQNGNITQAEIAEYQNLVNEFNAYIEQQRQLVDEHKALLDGWKTTLTNLGVSFTGTEEEQEQKYFELAQKICGLVSQLLEGKELADITADDLVGIQMDVEVIHQILDLVPGITPAELLARIQNSELNQQEININGEFLKYLVKMAVEGIRPQTVEELINKSLVVETARDLNVFDNLPANKQFMLLLYYFKLIDNDQERFNRLKAFFTQGTPCQDSDLVRFFEVLNQPYDTAKMQEARTLTNALDANSFVIKEASLREAKLLADSRMDHFVVFTPMAEFHPTGHAGYVGNLRFGVQQYNAQELYNSDQYLGLIILDMQQQGVSTVAVSTSISADTLGAVIDFYALPEGQGITPPSLTQPPAGSIRLPYTHAVSPFARQTFGDLLDFLNGDGLALLTPESRLQAIIYKAYLACQSGNCMLTFTPEEVEFMRTSTSGLAQLRTLLNGIVKTGDRTLSSEEKDLIYDSLTNIFSEENLYSDIPAISEEDKAALLALKAHLLSGRMGRNYINNEDILFALGCETATPDFFERFGLNQVPESERHALFTNIKKACEVLQRIAYSGQLNLGVRVSEHHDLPWYEKITRSVEEAVTGTFAPPTTPLQGIGTDVWCVAAAKAVFFPERVQRAHLEFMRSQILSAFFNSLYFENGAYHLDHDKLRIALEKLKEKVAGDADFCAKLDLILQNLDNLSNLFYSTTHGGLEFSELAFLGAGGFGETEVGRLVSEMSASLERYQLDINYLTSDRIDYAFMSKFKAQIQAGGFWEEQLHEIVATLFSGFVMVPGQDAPLTYERAAEMIVEFIDSLPQNWQGWASLSVSPQAQNNDEMVVKSLVAQFLSMRHPTDLNDGGFSLTAVAGDMYGSAASIGERLLGLPMTLNGGIYLKYQIVMMGGLQSVEGTSVTLMTLSNLENWNVISAQDFRTYGELIRKMYENMGPQNILLGLAPDVLKSLLQADTDLAVAGSEVFSIGGERSVLRDNYHTARQIFLAMYLSGRLEGHFEGSPQDLLHFNELLTGENVNWDQVLAMLGDKVKFLPNGEGSKVNPWDPNFNELSPGENNYWFRQAAAHPNGVEITTEDTMLREPGAADPSANAMSAVWDLLGLTDPEAIAISNRLNNNFSPISASRSVAAVGPSGVNPTVMVASPQSVNPFLAISPEAAAAWEALDLAISTSSDPEATRSWARGVFAMFEMLIGPLTNLDPEGGFEKFIESLRENASWLGLGEGIVSSLIQVLTFKFKFGVFMYLSVEFGIPIEVLREMGWDAGSIAGAFLKSLIPLFIFPSFGTVWLTDAVHRWNEGDAIGAILEFWMVNTMACRRHFANNQLAAISTWDKTFRIFDGLVKGLVGTVSGAGEYYVDWRMGEFRGVGLMERVRLLFETIKASFNDLTGPIEFMREHQFMQRSAVGGAASAIGDWGARWIVEGPAVQFERWMQGKSPLTYKIYEGVFTLGTGPAREYVGTPAEARSQRAYQQAMEGILESEINVEFSQRLLQMMEMRGEALPADQMEALARGEMTLALKRHIQQYILTSYQKYLKMRERGLSPEDIVRQAAEGALRGRPAGADLTESTIREINELSRRLVEIFEKMYDLEVQFEAQRLDRTAFDDYMGRVGRTFGHYALSPMQLLYIPHRLVLGGLSHLMYPTSLRGAGQMALQVIYQPALFEAARGLHFNPEEIFIQDPQHQGQLTFRNPEGASAMSIWSSGRFEAARQQAFSRRIQRFFRSEVNAEVARAFGYTEFNAGVRAQVAGKILEFYQQQYRAMRSEPGFSLSEFAESNFWRSRGLDLNVLDILEKLYQMEVREFQGSTFGSHRTSSIQRAARGLGIQPAQPVADGDVVGEESVATGLYAPAAMLTALQAWLAQRGIVLEVVEGVQLERLAVEKILLAAERVQGVVRIRLTDGSSMELFDAQGRCKKVSFVQNGGMNTEQLARLSQEALAAGARFDLESLYPDLFRGVTFDRDSMIFYTLDGNSNMVSAVQIIANFAAEVDVAEFARELQARGVNYFIVGDGVELTAADVESIKGQLPPEGSNPEARTWEGVEAAARRRTVVIIKPNVDGAPPIVYDIPTIEGFRTVTTPGGFAIEGDMGRIAEYKFGWGTNGAQIQEVWRNADFPELADSLKADIDTGFKAITQKMLDGVNELYRQRAEQIRTFYQSIPLPPDMQRWVSRFGFTMGLLAIPAARAAFGWIEDPYVRMAAELLTMHGMSAFSTSVLESYFRAEAYSATSFGSNLRVSLGRSFGLRGWGGFGFGLALGIPAALGWDAGMEALGLSEDNLLRNEWVELGVAWGATTAVSAGLEAWLGAEAFAGFSTVVGITALALIGAYLLGSWLADDVPDEFKNPQAEIARIRQQYSDPLLAAQRVYEYQVRLETWMIREGHLIADSSWYQDDGNSPAIAEYPTLIEGQIRTEDLAMVDQTRGNVEGFFNGWLTQQIQTDLESGAITYEDLCAEPEDIMERYYEQFILYLDENWLGLGDVNSESGPYTQQMYDRVYNFIINKLKGLEEGEELDWEATWDEIRGILRHEFSSVFNNVASGDHWLNDFIEKFKKVRGLLSQISILTNKFPGNNQGEYLAAFNAEGQLVNREALRGLVQAAWQTALGGLRTQAIVMTLLTMDANPASVNMFVEGGSPIPHVSANTFQAGLSYSQLLAAQNNSYAPSWGEQSASADGWGGGPVNFADPLVQEALEIIRTEYVEQITQHMGELIFMALTQLNETGSATLTSGYTQLDIELGLVNPDGTINTQSAFFSRALEILRSKSYLLDFRVAYLASYATQNGSTLEAAMASDYESRNGAVDELDLALDIYVHRQDVMGDTVSLDLNQTYVDATAVRMSYLIDQELVQILGNETLGILYGDSSEENHPPQGDELIGEILEQNPLTMYWEVSDSLSASFNQALEILRPKWQAQREALLAISEEKLQNHILVTRLLLAAAIKMGEAGRNQRLILEAYLEALGDNLLWTQDLEYVNKLAGLKDRWFALGSDLSGEDITKLVEEFVAMSDIMAQAAEGAMPYEGSTTKIYNLLWQNRNRDVAFKITYQGVDYYIRYNNRSQLVVTDECGAPLVLNLNADNQWEAYQGSTSVTAADREKYYTFIYQLLTGVFGPDDPDHAVLWDYLRALPQNLAEGQVIDLLVDVDGSM